MIGEPPRTQGDLNFSFFGIPVRIHPFFWLITLLLNLNNLSDITSVLVWLLAIFLAILCHELGHAGMMKAYGFSPRIILYGMGGLTTYDPSNSYDSAGSGTLGQVLISLAGPVAGFLLSGVLVGILILSGYSDHLVFVRILNWIPLPLVRDLPQVHLTDLLNYLFFISMIWGFVNLLPIYPLDGGQIVREIALRFGGVAGLRFSLLLSTMAAGVIAVFAAVRMKDFFIAAMFGYLAYSSYQLIEAYRHRDL